MGKELQMAREKEKRQPMLLAITGSGEVITTSCNRNKRTKESTTAKRDNGCKVEDTEAESKGSSETERVNAIPTEPKRRGRDYKDRKQGRGDEGEDKHLRRSAQQLGVVYPGSFCDEDNTNPHYWIEEEMVYGGILFKCKKCFDYLWLPLGWTDSVRLSKLIEYHGGTEGYCRCLNYHRPVKMLMAKMQELRRLAKDISSKREFAKLTDRIMSDREYDRKEMTNG